MTGEASLLPFWVMKTSLIGRPFVIGTPVVLVIASFVAWRHSKRAGARALVVLGSLLGAVLAAAIAVNGYFAYLPSIGALLGHRATYEASMQDLRTLQRNHEIPEHGLVVRVRIPGALHARAAQVYLPPAWFVSPRPSLGAIELLHGTPGAPEDWTRAGYADVAAERWAARHRGMAPVIVMADPNGGFTRDTECVDGREGRAETYLAVDVPAWVGRTFGVTGPWAVAGSSEGGYCAVMLAERHPATFVAFADFSGLDRPTHAHGARWLLGSASAVADHLPRSLIRTGDGPAGWFEVGSADRGPRRACVALDAALAQAGTEHHLTLVHGAHHTWRLWKRAFEHALPWLASRLSSGR